MAKSDVLVRMMADTKNYDANIAKARRQLDNFKKDNLTIGGILKQTSSSIMGMAAQYASIAAAIGAVGAAFKNNIATAREFEKSMSQLSSLTGMVGDDLNKLKGYAIELGSSTTLTASEVANAFKMIGSQQPQLLASGEALKAVTKQAITLSEAAGIDLATASQTLSTSINQMGGDSNNAARFVNVLAAASQKGAGDIAWLGEAITKSGTTAKAVGTDYEELVANLEQLAKAGFDASTAGTALRSIIMNLEKQANNNFKPSVVGLTNAFENLGKANMSVVGYQEIAGKMFASQAMALANAAGEARNMTDAITGTNTAEEQAKINTDNLDGSIKSLASAWEGFNLHLNSSNGLFKDIVDGLKDIVVWADKVIVKIGEVPNAENILTKNMHEVGSNVDDKGNYIRKPVGGTKNFNWDTGQFENGGYGATYNSQTGQTELGEIVVSGQKRTSGGGGGKKTPKGGGSTSTGPKASDFSTSIAKATMGADDLKGSDLPDTLSVWAMMSDEAKKSMLGLADATEDLGGALAKLGDQKVAEEMQKRIEEQAKKVDGLQKGWRTAAQAITIAGNALGSLNNPAIDIMTVIGQAVATIGMAYAETLAKDSTSKSNIWSFIAAAAAATISMATTIASLHEATGFAHGGTVEGSTYSGDQIPIMANAGEVILNRAQAGNVASQLEGNGLGNLHVVGKLHGTDMLLLVDRALKMQGKELATWGRG